MANLRVLPSLTLGLVVMLLVFPAAAAVHTFSRTYEASSAYVWGGATTGGAFAGTVVCNRDGDTLADTGACVRYFKAGTGGYDYRGGSFSITLTDLVGGTNSYYLIGFDVNGDQAVNCNGGEPCYIAKGTKTGTIPATGDSLYVFPATVKASGLTCCPETAATRGSVTITLS